ncbi:MAG: hypothetical protein QRY16_18065 [Enterobacterales bacterium endosymbiont of Blomia tropicalis]|nr:hypothetical protein [Mixta mediterraneensis]MDL4915605.1 hypothetical protein [Mixta mediterraneensis]
MIVGLVSVEIEQMSRNLPSPAEKKGQVAGKIGAYCTVFTG